MPEHKVSWDSLDGAVKLTLVDNINIAEIFEGQVPDRVQFNLDDRIELIVGEMEQNLPAPA